MVEEVKYSWFDCWLEKSQCPTPQKAGIEWRGYLGLFIPKAAIGGIFLLPCSYSAMVSISKPQVRCGIFILALGP